MTREYGEVPTPIAATSVADSPLLSTPSDAAFFDGTPMVMMAVADRDRRGRVDRSIDISHDSQWLPRHFGLAARGSQTRGGGCFLVTVLAT